jgi:hypothetical protein
MNICQRATPSLQKQLQSPADPTRVGHDLIAGESMDDQPAMARSWSRSRSALARERPPWNA